MDWSVHLSNPDVENQKGLCCVKMKQRATGMGCVWRLDWRLLVVYLLAPTIGALHSVYTVRKEMYNLKLFCDLL